MPCYEVNTISVEFSPKNRELLQRAVNALGWRLKDIRERPGCYEILTQNGQPVIVAEGTATGNVNAVNKLRVAYSQTLVEVGKNWMKSKGWQVSQTSQNKLSVKKGGGF